MKTILIVDDDPDIGNLLEEMLCRAGYRTARAYSGTEAALCVDRERPDLVLLDLMLPGLSGESLLPRLGHLPVIVLSAKDEPRTKAQLLQSGAADYMTKPFDGEELLARIALRLRDARAADPALFSFDGLSLAVDTRTAAVDGTPVRLTRTECSILRCLLLNPAQVLTKNRLLDAVSLDTPDCVESSLKVHVSNLRRKLRAVSRHDYIEAVWGIGFRLHGKS